MNKSNKNHLQVVNNEEWVKPKIKKEEIKMDKIN